ncbi:unnamed protein product [Zymoseptoria tritici ST99CH_3D7]|uniref:Uncharacterized protein n=1 Tax=Zymoseptoria tritici (strain ST99CH_3D7) TaxID=1276538 RepID=A0A1X7RWG8_ZYMT9|nr:unnamed protein product [Zymoseptoria tritici ST99CH_3D7]
MKIKPLTFRALPTWKDSQRHIRRGQNPGNFAAPAERLRTSGSHIQTFELSQVDGLVACADRRIWRADLSQTCLTRKVPKGRFDADLANCRRCYTDFHMAGAWSVERLVAPA